MTWRELLQATLTSLRALFGAAQTPDAPSSPDQPQRDAPLRAQSEQPSFPTVWEEPQPAQPPSPPEDQRPDTPEPASEPVAPDPVDTAPAEPSAAIAPEPEADDLDTPPAAVEAATTPPAQAGDPGASTDDTPSLSVVLESVLFVASEPVTAAQLARSLNVSEAEVQAELANLAEHYRTSGRGLRLQWLNGKVQLVTAPTAAPYVEAFLNLDATTRLSPPALETLAIVAYRQPVTRAQIEAIRGVDCASVLRSLVQRGLIAEVGRLESVGRPILYGVTEMFMQHFGLSDLKDLPPLEENEADRLWAASLLADPGAESTPEADTEPDADSPADS